VEAFLADRKPYWPVPLKFGVPSSSGPADDTSAARREAAAQAATQKEAEDKLAAEQAAAQKAATARQAAADAAAAAADEAAAAAAAMAATAKPPSLVREEVPALPPRAASIATATAPAGVDRDGGAVAGPGTMFDGRPSPFFHGGINKSRADGEIFRGCPAQEGARPSIPD